MKMIFKIAKTELQTLFYSPIAWLTLIVFTIQTSITFTNIYGGAVTSQALGHSLYDLTFSIFSLRNRGFFPQILQHLYLYIPLLTMGLMSRELSSGSIKQLYSSPVTNSQIILGKFLSMVVYSLCLIAILLIFVFYGGFTIQNFDFSAVLTGLLGIFLLILTYSAIGLFMSSLTSYQIVAAIGTFIILAALNMVGGLWQEIALVRDITWWLSIEGRAGEFINGLICSEDFLYFIIVIILFLALSILRLKANRQKMPFSKAFSRYALIFILAFGLGYVTSRPKMMFYHDSTRRKVNSLTQNSQEIVAKMDGKLTINTFSNILDRHYTYGFPKHELKDIDRFRQYVRFKPEIKMKFYRYYDRSGDKDYNENLDRRYPDFNDRERMLEYARINRVDSNLFMRPEEIRKIENLEPEGNRFVRTLVRENGQKTFLRIFDDISIFPSEAEISAAFKRLVMDLPKVGFVKGHGERDCIRLSDRDYNMLAQQKTFRYSLINQGFDFEEIELDKGMPDNIDILVIAEPRQNLSDIELESFDQYIDKGGNLILTGEASKREFINPLLSRFGVEFLPGILVKPSEEFSPDLIQAIPTKEGGRMMYWLRNMISRRQVLTMPGAAALSYENSASKGFDVTELFVTDTSGGTWSELQTTNFVDDTVKINPETGEVAKASIPVALALSRQVGEREQKIIVVGDADCISNGELNRSRKGIRASNYNLIMGSFFWLSDDEVPIDVRRPPFTDRKVYVGLTGMRITKWSLIGFIPLAMLVSYILMWLRRRGR